jgi:uncharacterized membrane protein
MFGLDPDTIKLWQAVFSLIGAVAGCIAAVISARNRIINRRAQAAAELAAQASGKSVQVLETAVDAMKRSNDAMLTAVATSESLKLRLHRIEQYMADQEVQAAQRERVDAPTRAIPTNGGSYLPTR